MFSIGAAMPMLMVVVSPASALVRVVSAASLGFLALVGAIGARAGGANVPRATVRVTFWARWRWPSPRASANYRHGYLKWRRGAADSASMQRSVFRY
jgi:hypothetical protein